MKSSISWIDRAGLKTTLARFEGEARPAPRRRESELLLDADEEFELAVELTPGAELEPATERLPEVLQTRPSEPSPAGEKTAAIADFAPSEGPLRSRLESFIEWLLELTGNDVAFIVDRDGLPLVDREADPDLLAVAASVMQLVESINGKLLIPLGSSVTLELESQQLTLTSVETPIGRYIVGQVGNRPIDSSVRSALADGLRRAFRPGVESEPALET